MDRRRRVALILGLVLCLSLLGRWVVRFDNEASPAPPSSPTAPQAPAGASGEIVQIPRSEPHDRGTVAYEAPIGPGVFRGRVIDAVTREPLREFTVEFRPRQGDLQPEQPPISRSFRTKDGRFEYRGLPAVMGTIFTKAPGYQRFDILGVRVPEDESSAKEILIPMRAGQVLRGRVIDELTKEPIASATISFREAPTGRFQGDFRSRPSVRSGKDGSFVFDGVAPGAIVVEASAANYASQETETFASDRSPPLEFALSKGGVIAGYLAGVDGITPVAGDVSLVDLAKNIAVATATGSAGEFSFPRLAAGRYQLAGHGGGLNGQREIELSRNERLEGIVLAMSPGFSVRGVVSGLRPEERASAYLYIIAYGTRSGFTLNSKLDERGAYEVRGVAPGSINIQVTVDTRGAVTKMAQMPRDRDLTVNLEFEPGARLSGRVTKGGKPLAKAMLMPVSEATEDILSLHHFITTENGEYSYEDVPDGDYVIRVETYASPRFRVSGDTVFDIDVPDVQLSGYVFEEGGKVPVVGARINLLSRQLRSHSDNLMQGSNNFGQFGLRGLQPGDYVLSAYKPGYELYRTPFSYGSPVSDMTIYLRPSRGVEIKVREAGTAKAIDNILVMETLEGSPGITLQLQPDLSGVSYLPSGLAGSSLRVSAFGYQPMEISDWKGQPLDLSLRRER